MHTPLNRHQRRELRAAAAKLRRDEARAKAPAGLAAQVDALHDAVWPIFGYFDPAARAIVASRIAGAAVVAGNGASIQRREEAHMLVSTEIEAAAAVALRCLGGK